MPLTSAIREFINAQQLGCMGTVNRNGNPHVVPVGSLIALTHDAMAFVSVRSPRILEDIARNSAVSIVIVDQVAQRGFRVSGAARVVTDPEHERTLLARYAGLGIALPEGPSCHVVAIDVYEASTLSRPATSRQGAGDGGETAEDHSTSATNIIRR